MSYLFFYQTNYMIHFNDKAFLKTGLCLQNQQCKPQSGNSPWFDTTPTYLNYCVYILNTVASFSLDRYEAKNNNKCHWCHYQGGNVIVVNLGNHCVSENRLMMKEKKAKTLWKNTLTIKKNRCASHSLWLFPLINHIWLIFQVIDWSMIQWSFSRLLKFWIIVKKKKKSLYSL